MKDYSKPFSGAYDCSGTADCMDCDLYNEGNPGLGQHMYDSATSEPGKNKIFPFVCNNGSFYYLAFYVFIWNDDKVAIDRIIIRPGYMLSSEYEESLDLYCSFQLESDLGVFETFMDNLHKVFPVMDDNYRPDQIGLLMKHAYWCALLNKINTSQWQYTQALLSDDGFQLAEDEVFSASIYEYLGLYGNAELEDRFKRFRTLRSKLNNESGIRITTPLPAYIETVNGLIEIALKYYSETFKWTEKAVNKRNEEVYVYDRDEYIVLMPTIKDVIKDAFAQHPYLLNFLDSYVNGNCRILLLRRSTVMNEPFTAIVIRDKSIESLFGPSGRLPEADVFKWLEIYAKALALKYRPDEIINELLIEEYDGSEGYSEQQIKELLKYAEQFQVKHNNGEIE